MKKIIILLLLVLGLSGAGFCKNSGNTQSDIKQKSCQNTFALINIDLSFMSPRGSASDVSFSEENEVEHHNNVVSSKEIPVVEKNSTKKVDSKNVTKNINTKNVSTVTNITKNEGSQEKDNQKTSLFRLDLLHLIKIQLF